jgi:hypothetical protein
VGSLLALGGLAVVSVQAVQLGLDLGVALGELRAAEVEGVERLLAREQVLGSKVALQALGDLIAAGPDAHVLHRRQHTAVALAGDDGAQDLLPRLAGDIGDDVGELDVHLRERLLHGLHAARLRAQQHRALARQRTRAAHTPSAGRNAPRSNP